MEFFRNELKKLMKSKRTSHKIIVDLDTPSSMWRKGELKEGLEELEQIEQSKKIIEFNSLQVKLLKIKILTLLTELGQAQELVTEVFGAGQRLNSEIICLDALILQIDIHILLKQFEQASKLIKQFETMIEASQSLNSHDQIKKLGQIALLKSRFYREIVDLTSATEYSTKALDYFNQIDYKWGMIEALTFLYQFHYLLGNHKKSLELCEKGAELCNKFGNKLILGGFYVGMANALSGMGQIRRAISFYLKAKKFAEEIQNDSLLCRVLGNLGGIYNKIGEPKTAIKLLDQCRTISQQIGDKSVLAFSLRVLGISYQLLGEFDQAKKVFLESISLYPKIGDYLGAETARFFLFLLALELNSIDQAKKYYEKIKRFVIANPSPGVLLFEKFMQAMLLKASSRPRDKFKAQNLFKDIVEEPNLMFVDYITIPAMLHLYELLLYELRISGDKEILEDIKKLNQRIKDFAETQNISIFRAEGLLLESKLTLLELDLERSQQLLQEALTIAEEKGLNNLILKITHEKFAIKDQMNKWESLIEKDASLTERLELTKLEDLIMRMAHKKLLITEDETLQYAQEAKQLVEMFETRNS